MDQHHPPVREIQGREKREMEKKGIKKLTKKTSERSPELQ